MESFEEKLTRKIQLSFMHSYKYLKQRVRRIREKNQKSFKCVSKQKRKKKHKETEFHSNSIQD